MDTKIVVLLYKNTSVLLSGKYDRSGWKRVKLGEVCKIIMGQSPNSSAYNESGDGRPLIQGNADIEDRETISRTYTRHITKVASGGDLILTVRAPVGNIAHASFDCCIGRGVCALHNAPNYLYYYFESMEGKWGHLSGGSTFDSINPYSLFSMIQSTLILCSLWRFKSLLPTSKKQ